ncbi:helix-turn-helix domain-containing protein [Sporomusa termitida]|uniref:HTH-type transcriptional activator RhaR n=1 Tax=Sporomusa termitida TaxID=2377 RepID=A0A517DWJ7_9FIRM|nr:AraC family transcriptional regulator [Sporomusa termitida]QDR81728.1 HTH-type transcriptional activator RhaR [Sporomusa termitida]
MNGWEAAEKTVPAGEEHWLMHNNRPYVMYSTPDRVVAGAGERFGRASVRHLFSGPFARIRDTELTFGDSIAGGARFAIPHIVLYFCLAGQFALEENDLAVDDTNFLAFRSAELRQVRFQSGLYNRIITVEIYPEQMQGVDSSLQALLPSFPAGERFFSNHRLSPGLRHILQQLIDCPYPDPVRELYIEGKLLELLAVYFNETVYRQAVLPDGPLRLSRQDITSLQQARQLLDRNFITPPTLAGLARMVCLNEFKLKNGFKQVFGQTVHSYVVDKRLELAVRLLTEKKLNIGEVASHIGYANASYFALAFRKKNGINPREYLAQRE